MAELNRKKNSGLWAWIVIALIVAALVVATLMYIGWFDTNTHVDSNNGDNVRDNYELTEQNAQSPGEADWQNADGRSLDAIITEQEPASGSAQ